MTKSKKRLYFLIVLFCGVFAAMATSLLIGLNQSVWFDEAYSILVAKQPIGKLIYLTSIDTHPPFYYLMLKAWAGIFGWSEMAVRSLSVLFMGGSMIIAGLLVKRLFGLRAAFIALPFILFAPFLLRYGFEVRMYAAASFIGMLATYVLVGAIESRNKNKSIVLFGVYAVLVAMGMYTLYYTVFIWASHLIWLLWRSYQNKEWTSMKPWIISYILSIVIFLPWLPTVLRQLSSGALAPITQPMTFDNIFGVISFSFFYKPIWGLGPWLSLLMLALVMAIIYISFHVYRLTDKKTSQYLILLALYWVAPLLMLALIGLMRPMYVERYLAHFIIGESMFIGAAASIIMKKTKIIFKVVYVFMIVCMLIGVFSLVNTGNYNFQRLQRTEIKRLPEFVNCNGGQVVFVDDPYYAVEFSYYLSDCTIYFYSKTDNHGGGYAPVSNKGHGISNPAVDLDKFDEIYHVYYGGSEIKLPDDMGSVSTDDYNGLTIKHLVSR